MGCVGPCQTMDLTDKYERKLRLTLFAIVYELKARAM